MSVTQLEQFYTVASANMQIQYEINNPYDAFQTGLSNVQPALWDELMGTMYERCYCYAAKVDVEVVNGDSDAVLVTLFPCINATDISGNIELMNNQPGVRSCILGKSGSGKEIGRMSIYAKVRNYYPKISMSNLLCTASADPTYYLYASLCGYNVAGSSRVNFHAKVRITFYVNLSRVSLVPES